MKYVVGVSVTEYHVYRYEIEAESAQEAERLGVDKARHNAEPDTDECYEWFIDGDTSVFWNNGEKWFGESGEELSS